MCFLFQGKSPKKKQVKKRKKRTYQRQKQFCKICKKLVSQLPRHLTTHKETDPEMRKLEFLSPKRRTMFLSKIRKEGAYLLNTSSASTDVITSRPSVTKKKEEYEFCPNCKFMYLNLKKHLTRCKGIGSKKTVDMKPGYETDDMILIEEVLNNMKNDHIFELIAKDRLILEYGSRLLAKNRKEKNIFYHVATKMREVGRLVDQLRSQTQGSIKQLEQCLEPASFPKVVQAIKVICGFDPVKNTYEIPSLPTKIGFALKECTNILQVEAAIEENKEYMEQLQYFQILYEKDYSHQINNHARQTLRENKWNKKCTLPEASDIARLVTYLETNEAKCIARLDTQFDADAYQELSTLFLVHLIVFNRKRAGEVSKVTTDFMSQENRNQMDEESNKHTLNAVERKLAELMNRVEIRGKKNKGVPLLLTPHLNKCCNILSKNRQNAGIPSSSKYFFAKVSNPEVHIRGADAIRQICQRLKVKNITSTSLRKHLATMVQIMSLPNNELDRLAEFMGHSLDVHRNFYRLKNDIQDRAKMAKLFLFLSKGSKYIDKIKNKTFDNIDFTHEMIGELVKDEEQEEESDEDDREESNKDEREDESDEENKI
uniref:Uncharacterized protein n=2 Tax=Cacopsylla melanoneura TaxID=428564 RepID=A0A8D8VWG1_9HEMI